MTATALSMSVEAARGADAAAWTDVRARLRIDDAQGFDAWLAKLRLVSSDDATVTLGAATRFLKLWIDNHYADRILARWRDAVPAIARVRIVVSSLVVATAISPAPAAKAVAPARPAPKANALARSESVGEPERPRFSMVVSAEEAARAAMRLASPLRPEFSFATFCEGPSNALALTAANAALTSTWATRRAMNPLFIHGRVGHGKTHLLQAIVGAADVERAVYISAEKFCATVGHAMRRSGTLSTPDDLFRNDIVAIDDIHFVIGVALRREFARTVERLMEDGRQVVVASDRSADQLDGLDDRLRSRLRGGLEVTIERMDRALRVAVLARKIAAAAELAPGFAVPDDVVAMVGDKVTRGGRDLEGAVNRLVLLHGTNGRVTMATAEAAISDLAGGVVPPQAIKIETIKTVVARFFDCSMADLVSDRRTQAIVRPRQVVMLLAKEMTARSLPEIGRRIGGRDHTTVLHAVRKLGMLAQTDPPFADELAELRRQILEASA